MKNFMLVAFAIMIFVGASFASTPATNFDIVNSLKESNKVDYSSTKCDTSVLRFCMCPPLWTYDKVNKTTQCFTCWYDSYDVCCWRDPEATSDLKPETYKGWELTPDGGLKQTDKLQTTKELQENFDTIMKLHDAASK
jgi:hypothetical protein